ncbi:MAG TPA: molybdopterin-dependent oxidoreductase [Candidatus Limnocylindrales bacterium]|nr:molybdopterin-dependent oxidoreductase [Candidatus Limnocylindrales bacterium]
MSEQPTPVRTTCAYCGVGCGIVATTADGNTTIAGDAAHPANGGLLCSKGAALAETLGHGGRLLRPRVHGRDTGWDEALELVAHRFRDTIAKHGPDSVAFYVSGQLLTEDYYVFNKLMKGFIGSANIDTNSRLCMSSSVVGHQRAFGEDIVPGCYEDFDLADLVVLVGSNLAWCHPVLFRRLEDARQRRPDMRIVVIDPRQTPTAGIADLHLAIRAGSDVELFNGLLAWLDREGCRDYDFLEEHTIGAVEAVAAARESARSSAVVAAACGLAVSDLEEFYRMFAATARVVTAFSQGVNQSSSGSDKVTSIVNCHLLTGRIGKPGMGPFSLTGQPNAMGGREVGGMANMLAAHMSLDDPGHRRIVQEFWKSPRIASRPGLKAVDLFEAVREGRIKALWIVATNPAVSLPAADRVRDAIASCDFVVVSDCAADTDTAVLADVLLPAAAWGERDGTTTNSERRISRQRAFLNPPGEARPDWWILSRVAERMGYADAFAFESVHEIFDEHARLSSAGNDGARAFDIGGLAGLSAEEYESLEPIQWPVPERGHRGTARLAEHGAFFHPSGCAHLVPTTPRRPSHETCMRFPFVLNTGRIRDQWHTMTRTGTSPRLSDHMPEPYVDLHPDDAATIRLDDGDFVKVTTAWGAAVLRSRTSGEMPRGMLFAPMHWSDANCASGRVGALVNPAVDPASGEPELKHTPAAIERVVPAWHGVLFGRTTQKVPDAELWTRVCGDGFVRFELAGLRPEQDLAARGRLLLNVQPGRADLLEYADEGAGIYRAAIVRDDRIAACVFLSRRAQMPSRDWIAGLLAKPALDENDRMALLAGRPLAGATDNSPIICSCFNVRRSAIDEAIDRHGLQTPEEVGSCTRAGTNCGSCVPEIRTLLGVILANRSRAA